MTGWGGWGRRKGKGKGGVKEATVEEIRSV